MPPTNQSPAAPHAQTAKQSPAAPQAQTAKQSPAAPQAQTAKQSPAAPHAQTAKQSPAAPQAQPAGPSVGTDNHPPSTTGGTPTITDTATLSPPDWIECDIGSLKDLDRDRLTGTPFVFKLTSQNRRLQYRLGSDGYVRGSSGINGIGDTYAGMHYLFESQEHFGYDIAGRLVVKIPSLRSDLGGTRKFDFTGLWLASRDFTKWGLHGDFNAGVSSLSRPDAPGTDTQFLLAGSTTVPFKGGRWQYTNELVYFSPVQGQHERITTMHGVAFAQHRFEIYSAAVQWQLQGDGAVWQVLFAGSFFVSKLH